MVVNWRLSLRIWKGQTSAGFSDLHLSQTHVEVSLKQGIKPQLLPSVSPVHRLANPLQSVCVTYFGPIPVLILMFSGPEWGSKTSSNEADRHFWCHMNWREIKVRVNGPPRLEVRFYSMEYCILMIFAAETETALIFQEDSKTPFHFHFNSCWNVVYQCFFLLLL